MARRMRWRSRWTVLGVAALLVLAAGFTVALTRSGSDAGGDAVSSPSYSGVAQDGGADAAAPAPYPEQMATLPAQGVPVGGVAPALVRTAQVSLEVPDATVGVRDVRLAAVSLGGTVAEERAGDTGGWVVVRVPADALDRLVDQVAALGTVTDRSAMSIDVTEEVVDLDARVESQTASVARVRALLAQATSIADIVAVESELALREAELDSLTARLTMLSGQVAMSTLTVDLRSTDAPAGVGATDFLGGLAAGWEGLLQLGAGTGVVIGFVLPFLPVLAVLGGIAWLLVRIVRGRRAGGAARGREGES